MSQIDDLLKGMVILNIRDAKDYDFLFKSAITTYTKASGIKNNHLTAAASVAICTDGTYAAATSQFKLATIPAMTTMNIPTIAMLKLGTEKGASSVANAGSATYVDTVTTASLTGATYHLVVITLAATQTITFTQLTAVCPTTLTLGVGTHTLLVLKDAETEAATIICTPAVASAAGVSGILAGNVAKRVRVFPVEEILAGDFSLVN
jgi:hypothetical protein